MANGKSLSLSVFILAAVFASQAGADDAPKRIIRSLGNDLLWLFISDYTTALPSKALLGLFVIAPLGTLIVKLDKARNKFDYGNMSSLLKWVMLAGLVSIVVISKNIY